MNDLPTPQAGNSSAGHARLLGVVAALLILISIPYLVYGFMHLVYLPTIQDRDNSAIDLRLRWIMQRILYSGHNPLVDDYEKDNIPEQLWKNDPYVRDFHPYQAIYPPWAFLSQTFLIATHDNFQVCRTWFAVVNLITVAVTGLWGYQLGRPHGRAAAWFMLGVVLAVMGHLSALRVGQYGIVINACLIGMYWLEGRRGEFLRGFCSAWRRSSQTSRPCSSSCLWCAGSTAPSLPPPFTPPSVGSSAGC